MDKPQITKLTNRQVSRREEKIESFTLRLELFLKKNVRKVLKRLEKADISAIEAAKVLGGLRESLLALGLQDELTEISKLYGSELNEIKEKFERVSKKVITYTATDIDVVESLISFDTAVIDNRLNLYIDDIKATMMRSILANQPVDLDLLQDAAAQELNRNVKTDLNTSMQGFSRSVNLLKADDAGIELFLYSGPDDSLTRPFCDARLGKVFNRSQIEEWDNEQGLPADIYLGGYNCRHELVPVDEETAKELGYGD